MLQKITLLLVFLSISIVFFAYKGKFRSAQPPSHRSGAPGDGLCTGCHTSFALNSGGGGVTINGLPSTFKPGQTYPFTVTISHGTDDRTRWGFEINARNSNNVGVGSFTTTNPNAGTIADQSEIGHKNAVFTEASSSYTYTDMSWTAPVSLGTGDDVVNFYVAGNAANGNFNNQGDYIYSNVQLITLPVQLQSFLCTVIDDHSVRVDWRTSTESNSKEFIVEKSDDSKRFYTVSTLPAAGTSAVGKSYSYVDDKPSFFNQPVYYRIKQVDLDGNFKYSKIVSVSLKGRATFVYSLSPNPVQDHFTLGIVSDENTIAEAEIVSPKGQVVLKITLKLAKGRTYYTLPVLGLQHGAYFLRLFTTKGAQTIPFVAL